jgi:chemotaxis protein methyltransferase CheR
MPEAVEPVVCAPMLATSELEALGQIRRWVQERLGIRFADDQTWVLQRRLHLAWGGAPALFVEIEKGLRAQEPEVVTRVAELASTNHTYFFREPETFALLGGDVLAALPSQGPLRVWSAASSSGEEAYTIAMCLLDQGVSSERLQILGTDISRAKIEEAERGVYATELLNQVPEHHRRSFRSVGKERVAVVPPVAQCCTFRLLNLTRLPWPFERRFHVTFLRNVLYYFNVDVRLRIVEACYDATEPGGFLVLGLSEPLHELQGTRWALVGPGLLRKEAR